MNDHIGRDIYDILLDRRMYKVLFYTLHMTVTCSAIKVELFLSTHKLSGSWLLNLLL